MCALFSTLTDREITTRMDAIELLMTRTSNGKLQEPAPDDATLRIALQAAARAPDHGTLRPLRIRIVRGDARLELGKLMAGVLARKQPSSSREELEKMRNKALRAPLVLVVGANIKDSPKVPAVEQILCAGAAAQNLLFAFHALGFAAMWRTGDAAYDSTVKRALGFAEQDAIVGFLYVGTAKLPAPSVVRPEPEAFSSEWHGVE
jgi:nitroreductase